MNKKFVPDNTNSPMDFAKDIVIDIANNMIPRQEDMTKGLEIEDDLVPNNANSPEDFEDEEVFDPVGNSNGAPSGE